MLQWPIFDTFPQLRQNVLSTHVLEASRAPIELSPLMQYPYALPSEVDRIIDTFQRNVNFWMPTISLYRINQVREIVLSRRNDLTCDVCIAMLVMALGWACEYVEQKLRNDDGTEESVRHSWTMSSLYFEAASRANFITQMEMSPVAAQCLLLTALSPPYCNLDQLRFCLLLTLRPACFSLSCNDQYRLGRYWT